ncbi:MAG: PilZ domain-containing protein [Candidatus Omnitrophica bacterium]|nr:PilZ domain-containing protein [Candidatus Omnitrophota bacterium]
MSQKDLVEKRRSPRIEHSVPVKICAPCADLVTETRNISRSGAYCRVSKYLEPMTKLQVTLMLPVKKEGKLRTRKIVCMGVVVRVENVPFEDSFNVAIFFNEIKPADSRALSEHVQGVLAEKPAG